MKYLKRNRGTNVKMLPVDFIVLGIFIIDFPLVTPAFSESVQICSHPSSLFSPRTTLRRVVANYVYTNLPNGGKLSEA